MPVVWDDVQAAFARQRRPLPAGVIVHAWQGGHAVARSLAAGAPTLASPQEATYLNHRATGLRTCFAWDPASDGCGALPAAAAGAAAGLLLGGAAAGFKRGRVPRRAASCDRSAPSSRCGVKAQSMHRHRTGVATRPRAPMLPPQRILSSGQGGHGLPRAQRLCAVLRSGPASVRVGESRPWERTPLPPTN